MRDRGGERRQTCCKVGEVGSGGGEGWGVRAAGGGGGGVAVRHLWRLWLVLNGVVEV
jgi:hypothetical protein